MFSVRAPADEHGFDGGVRFAMVIIPHFERVFAGALAIQEEAMRQRYLSSHTLCVMTAEFGRTSRDHIGMYGDRVLLGMVGSPVVSHPAGRPVAIHPDRYSRSSPHST